MIVLLVNPRSGRGRGVRAAAEFGGALRAGGREVREVVVGGEGRLEQALEGAELLVVAGGDGSVLRAAPAAIGAGVPVYHIPCGNENLFAREFGMDRRVGTLMRALERGRTVRVDVGVVGGAGGGGSGAGEGGGEAFLIMCSAGPDAGVIHRLAGVRGRAVGHLAYCGPVLAEVWRPRIPRVRVTVDGRRVVDGGAGIVLVGNSRRYALGIDPALHASMTDGVLDVVFLPCAGRRDSVLWAVRCRMRRGVGRGGRGAVYEKGREVVIEGLDGPPLVQADGEALPVGGAGGAEGEVRISVRPGCLPVLAV